MNNKTRFWDCSASIYDIFVNIINARTHKALREKMATFFEPEDIVLECACGTGMLTEVIAPRCRELIATDFSERMLEKAEKKCKNHNNISFKLADISSLGFKNATFDKVVAGNVIHLLKDPNEALKELDRVCKPKGKIVIPTYINKQSNKKENQFAKIIEKFGAGFQEKFTFSSYRKFFTNAGYVDVQYIRVEGFIPCSIAIISKK